MTYLHSILLVVIARLITMRITSVTVLIDVAENNYSKRFLAESNTLHSSRKDSVDELNLIRQLDHV